MKHYVFIIICLITSSLITADLVIDLPQYMPEINHMKDIDYQMIYLPEAMLRGEMGEPALPWMALSILLPPGEEAVRMELEFSNPIIRQLSKDIYPNQPVQHFQAQEPVQFMRNAESYTQDAFLPAISKGTLENESWFGFNILLTSYCPVQYNPLRKEMRYYKEARLKVITQSQNRTGLNRAAFRTEDRAELVKQLVINQQQINNYSLRDNRELNTDLLIITPAEYIDDFQNLQNYYQLYGWQVAYVSTEYIEENLPGIDLQEKIRNHIINEFNENGISYVLLGGDVEYIPYRGFYCQVESTTLYEDTDIPSELYYSALDGNWDTDNNGIFGEIGEGDLLPDVAVARLPFSDETELATMLAKMISYTQQPVNDDLNKPLLLGEHLWLDPLTYGADYLDLIIGFHDDNGYSTLGIPEDDEYIYLTDRDQGQWSVLDFFAALSEGVSFVHHAGHSSSDYMMRMHSEDIIESNFSLLNGIDHNMPVLYSHGCICGGFDYEDCIAEEALKLPVFTPAFIGNSRYGWFNEGQTEGPSGHIHREFVNSLYNDKENHIAMAHLLSKVRTAPWLTAPGQHEFGAIRWCFYDCNVLADAVMPIWTSAPQGVTVNYPSQVNSNSQGISIYIEYQHSNEPAANFRAVLLQDDIIIGKSVADTLGICDIEIEAEIIPTDDIILSVSGYNILPQQYPISVITTPATENDIPVSPLHLINYPNPFNPSTEISFDLETAQQVELSIYSIRGQLVKTLLKASLSEGYHAMNWDGTDSNGSMVNSGIYIARLQTSKQKEEIKMLLVK